MGAFNKPTVVSVLDNKTDYIPHSLIKSVKHYKYAILITTYSPDGTGENPVLYVTKEFTTNANGISGEFEREPYTNASPVQKEDSDPGNKAYTLAKSAKLFGR